MFGDILEQLDQNMHQLFHAGGPYHIEISPLICRINQWAGFYMVGTSVMKDLTKLAKGDLVCTEISSYLFSE